jgi:hypothetical protein
MSLGTIAAIRAALETRLDTITPALATVYENVAATPVQGTPFQRATLMPAQPDNPTFEPGFYVEQGVFHVLLCYPLGKGSAEAMARAELIRTNFPRGLSLVKDGVITIIERTPEIGVSNTDDAFYLLPVLVRWYANVNI